MTNNETGIKKDSKNTQKKQGIAKPLIIVLLALAILVGGFFLLKSVLSPMKKASVEGLEPPLLYITDKDELKIKKSSIPDPVDLGNQGFSTKSNFVPVITSQDNSKIAYLTKLNALFVVPVEEALSGVIDPKYLVSESATAVLSFAPDSHNILYYLNDKGHLVMYDIEKEINTTLSEKFFLDNEGFELPIFSVANDFNIVYYEVDDGKLVLCIKKVNKKDEPVRIDKALLEGIKKPDDQGFYFYQEDSASTDPENPDLILSFYNFQKQTYSVVHPISKDIMTISKSVDGHAVYSEITSTKEAPAKKDDAGTTTPTTPPEPTTDTTVVAEEEVAVIDQTTGNEIEEILVDELVAEDQPVNYYALHYYNGKDNLLIAENVVEPIFSDETCQFVLYAKENGDKITLYFHSLKNGDHMPVELFSADSIDFLEYSSSKQSNSFAISRLTKDQKSVEIILYSFDENGNISDTKTITDKAFSLLKNTINSDYIFIENPSTIDIPEGFLYICDLYSYSNGEKKLIDKNVELYSIGKTVGTMREDSVLFYITDVSANDGLVVGTLKMYDGKESKIITDSFSVPDIESVMPVVYENNNLVYYMTFMSPEGGLMNLYEYSGGNSKQIDSKVIDIVQ